MFRGEDRTHAGGVAGAELDELIGAKLKHFQEGDIVKGRVVEVTADSVMVDIGYKSEGVAPAREFLDKDGVITVKSGDDIMVMIERRDDDGALMLSKAKADQLKVWDAVIESSEKGTPVEGTITQRVKGGFHVDLRGLTAFLPGSQVDLRPVNSHDSLVGKSFSFRVLKYDRRKNNVIVSRRALLEVERERMRKETLAVMEEGKLMEGTVKNITDYGAFIDLGGIDGLVHLSDLSWGKAAPVAEVLRVGDKVTVMVLKYSVADGKISLGIKQTKPDPWVSAAEKYRKGAKVKGKVVNITDYGAFIELEDGVEGLAHISEISWAKLKHPSQKLKAGEVVDAVVLDVDPQAKRISLGMKQLESNPWDTAAQRYPKGTRIKGVVKNITDFGVFIGIEDGIDGLAHISDLSWKKLKHPSELFKKGQEVEAVVVNIDSAARRFSLSTKFLEKNPWEAVEERYKPGMIVAGRVTSIAEFGAFVEIEEGLEGLVHVSELSRGKKKGTDVKVGDVVQVEVLNVDPEDNKIGLSIRSFRKEEDAALAHGKDTAADEEAGRSKEGMSQGAEKIHK
ncbi:MAG: 30S ribosomal protein S1 [Deltaproteobacteria bacterium]|nr:30S ribosomal protein S1 [Deltaproteobacteria bacterium]